MRNLLDGSRIQAELGHHLLALESRDGEDGILVLVFPSAIVVEVPDGGVDILGFVGGVVRLVKDESADGIGAGGSEIGLSAVDAEPRGKGDEIIVGRREVGAAGDVSGNEVVLLGITRRHSADVGNV